MKQGMVMTDTYFNWRRVIRLQKPWIVALQDTPSAPEETSRAYGFGWTLRGAITNAEGYWDERTTGESTSEDRGAGSDGNVHGDVS